MTQIEKIRQEIIRQAESYQDTFTDGMRDNLIAFVDTLEEEESSDDLEEAAEKYCRESCNKAMLPNIDGPMPEYGGSIKDAFKAGADWQEEQQQETIELAEEHAYFAGKEKMREELLEWAKDMKHWYESPIRSSCIVGATSQAKSAAFQQMIDTLNSM